jgi:hypothetical protein
VAVTRALAAVAAVVALGPAPTRLLHAGVVGRLFVVDRGCVLHAVRLPSLDELPAPRVRGCIALVSPATAPPGWSLWPRHTTLAAWCEQGRVIVAAPSGPELPMIGGCAPAWKPDGSITYVRRGSIVQFPRTGRALVVRTASELTRALGATVERVTWLSSTRFAVVTRRKLAVFSGRQLVAVRRIRPGVIDLRASPRGTFVVLRRLEGVRVYDARLRPQRGFANASAIAWSPDERWVAASDGTRTVLRRGRLRIVLPLRAVDLAWLR